MRALQNILDISQFISLMSEVKKSHSSLPWWDDCVSQVKLQVLNDRTTSRDNLREKAKNYASNYIALQTEVSFIQKNLFLDAVADEVEKDLENVTFEQSPPAGVVARNERERIPDEPLNKYIKLSP